MATVERAKKRVSHWIVIAIILVLTILYLIPTYWVISSSFKPFKAVTAIPPKVLFKPEITSYIKLFTKRSQVRSGEELEERLSEAKWYETKVLKLG